MQNISLTHWATSEPRNPSDQPYRSQFSTISEALVQCYKLTQSRGFQVGTEIRKDGNVIYDENTLATAMRQIRTLVNDGSTIDDAATTITNEDGH